MKHPEWAITKVVRPTDLRTVKWNATYLQYTSRKYKLRVGEAVLFINKKGDKCRVLIRLSDQLDGVMMLPVDPKGDVWGDCYNAAHLAGTWLSSRQSSRTPKRSTKTLFDWLDDMVNRSSRYQAWKKTRRKR
jgi:hypothetical protein